MNREEWTDILGTIIALACVGAMALLILML